YVGYSYVARATILSDAGFRSSNKASAMETSLPTNGEATEAMTDKFQGINLRRGGEAWMYIGNLPFKRVSPQTVLNGKGAGYICTTSFGAVRSDSVAFRIMRLHNSIKEGHHPFDPATHDLARENKWVPQLKLMKDFRWDDMKWRIRVLSVAYCEPRAYDQQRTIAEQYLNLLATIDIIYHGTFRLDQRQRPE
ncbi:MAG: hypothetical protein LQ341_006294, partial [Variospora aurantia]